MEKKYNTLIDVIFSGGDKGNKKNILNYAKKLGINNRIIFTGFIPNEDLANIYKMSLALVMPTFFGPTNIPPLEAFKIGTPVIYPDLDGLKDQIQDAGLLVDLHDPETLSTSVLELIENPYVFMNKINNVLKENGVGVLSVPAYQGLFSDHDVNLQHFRRYNWQTLKNELDKNFKLRKRIGYNFLLLPIRFIQIKIIKSVVSDTTVNSFINKVLTMIVRFEVILLKMHINLKIGLSLFAVFRKKYV